MNKKTVCCNPPLDQNVEIFNLHFVKDEQRMMLQKIKRQMRKTREQKKKTMEKGFGNKIGNPQNAQGMMKKTSNRIYG